jgi:iron complex transport system permease protein|tara:strand:- start:469 stop:1566 length:1098 start_codon:yes stop_codon:yes gene_type:complete
MLLLWSLLSNKVQPGKSDTALANYERLRPVWLLVGIVSVLAVAAVSLSLGPANISVDSIVFEIIDRLPLLKANSELSEIHSNIIWEVRLPRVILGGLVGATLALSGATYQAVFRNPLADPYLLGAAAGAGLGATLALVNRWGDGSGASDAVPLLAFCGALLAVAITYFMGLSGDSNRSPASLLLAGVAVASFLTAIQTFILQQNADTIRQVYTWILGRLNTASWGEVWLLLPYAIGTSCVILLNRRILDVMRLGDAEAASLGIRPDRTRKIMVVAASLATAAAVAVSGLISFVGIIVPHTIRLLFGSSNRIVLPLSMLFGASFMIAVDLLGRTVISPSEIPIGVITSFCGAPFFIFVLRSSRRSI